MPLFVSDEEFARCAGDAALVAERADDFIRKLFKELETVKAESDAASITAEQTCSLLEQKYLSLSAEFSELQTKCAELQSSIDRRSAELAEIQSQKHQLHLQCIAKDGEIERLTAEVSGLHKSKRQLLEVVEHKDLELSEKNATIKSYLDKIVSLTNSAAQKEARVNEIEAELARSQAACSRLSQEKELVERHNSWLNDELKAKVDNLIELRRTHADLESDMSSKLADVERQLSDATTNLKWSKGRVRELETTVTSLQEELSSSKESAAANEERFSAEVSTVHKLVDLYKESSEEWSRKAKELEGVIKALETHLAQLETDYKDKLEKEASARVQTEKEAEELKGKLEKCEAEIESLRKENELSLLPLSNFNTERSMVPHASKEITDTNGMIVPRVPAGVSGTALAASLLRDGWSLATMYAKYHEAVDAFRHEQMGRKDAEAVLQRVLYELEEKAELIQDERAEHERMVEAYSLINQKLQQFTSERTNLEKTIVSLKADMKRQEREYVLAQKEIDDLQEQITVLLKECRDIQLRCGSDVRDHADLDSTKVSFETNGDTEKIISERLLTFKDIKGLVEQNVQLRTLVRSFTDQINDKENEYKDKFEFELKKHTEEAALKVAAVLQRAEEQAQMIESLHTSVAMYKRLYEEEHKRQPSHLPASVVAPDGRADFKLLIEGSQEAAKKAQEHATERVRSLEEELDRSRAKIISLQAERDKLTLEANFVRDKVESLMKESEHKRQELDGVLARNVEFSQIIVDYQRKLRDSSESLHSAEELSRKLTMEVSFLKHEKELLANAEKRACDEVKSLSERVHRLQATLDTVQSAEEIREEARAAEKRKQEDYIKQIQMEWAEAKKELQEERHNNRNITLDRDQTLKNAMKQVEDMGQRQADALQAVAAAEAKAAVAEARLSDLEKKIRSSESKFSCNDGNTSISTTEVVQELRISREDLEKLKEETKANREHMLQYKSIAEVNESALKQMEHAHENFKAEAERLKGSFEAEVLTLRERVSQLETEVSSKSEQVASAIAAREEALASSSTELMKLREETAAKTSEIVALETKLSLLEDKWKDEHDRWRSAHANYERQVVLQSETIQELTRTSEALALLQEEASELRKLAGVLKSENDELKSKWAAEKLVLEELKNAAEKKYNELNEQNKILHDRLEAMHIQLAERDRSGGNSGGAVPDSSLQNVINYLRRTKEIAETEISLLKQEKLRLQSQLESALKAAETAQASLHAERASSRAKMFTEDEFKSLQHQIREMNLLRESNLQLREENKHNFEECQKLREEAHKIRVEFENQEKLLREKQAEVDACKKEIEWQKAEKAQLEKSVAELRLRCGNIDKEQYERMKNDVSQLQEKIKEKDSQIEEYKTLASQKQDTVSQLEVALQNCRAELNEKEKRVADLSQVEEKQRRHIYSIKRRADISVKEKEELSKENQTLLKQLEELKQGKNKEELIKENQTLLKQLEELKQARRPAGDVTLEQAMKEKEEKDTRIQMLEKTVEMLRDGAKKEREKRLKSEETMVESLNRAVEEKNKVCNELEKHKQAVKQLSHELENMKQAEDSLPEGTSIVDLSGNTLDDLASGYVSAVESLEKEALSLTGGRASLQEPSTDADTTSLLPSSGTAVQAPTGVPKTSNLKPAVEERDKRPLVSKNVRRLLRPRLKVDDGQQQDAEMSEAENAAKQILPPRQDAAPVGSLNAAPVQQPLRKRQQPPSVTESEGEATSKRSKGLDLPQQQDVTQIEPVVAVEEASDVLQDKEVSTDIQMEETQISSEKIDEDLQKELQPLDEAVENLDKAGGDLVDATGLASSSGTVPAVEDQIELGNNQLIEESDKEEGELVTEDADLEGGGADGDASPEAAEEGDKPDEAAAATTPTASPLRASEDVDVAVEEEALSQDENKGEEGEITEDSPLEPEEASSKKAEVEQQQVSSETSGAVAESLAPTPSRPPIQRSPSPVLSPSTSSNLTTAGTTINLRERAREKAALRQAGGLPSITPSRGRAVPRGRLGRGGGRVPRGGRTGGQPPSGDSNQGSR